MKFFISHWNCGVPSHSYRFEHCLQSWGQIKQSFVILSKIRPSRQTLKKLIQKKKFFIFINIIYDYSSIY